MNGAADAFSAELASAAIARPRIPVYSDVTALPYGEEIAPLLAKQICSPVKWEAIIRSMISSGVDTFIEIGPGKTLTNLIARIDKSVRAFPVTSFEDLTKLVKEASAC